jgi:hypothetical protein
LTFASKGQTLPQILQKGETFSKYNKKYSPVMLQYQKAASRIAEDKKKVNYRLLLSIAIGIFGYFHYRYRYRWKS